MLLGGLMLRGSPLASRISNSDSAKLSLDRRHLSRSYPEAASWVLKWACHTKEGRIKESRTKESQEVPSSKRSPHHEAATGPPFLTQLSRQETCFPPLCMLESEHTQ
jgi:hypothetical protein